MPFCKQYVEIRVNDKVVEVLEVKQCSPAQFLEKQREARSNRENLEKLIKLYKNKIANLEKEIKILKGEE